MRWRHVARGSRVQRAESSARARAALACARWAKAAAGPLAAGCTGATSREGRSSSARRELECSIGDKYVDETHTAHVKGLCLSSLGWRGHTYGGDFGERYICQPSSAKLGPSRAKFDRHRPSLPRFGADVVSRRPHTPSSAGRPRPTNRAVLGHFGQSRPNSHSDRFRPNLCRLRPTLADYGPNLGMFRTMLARTRPNVAVLARNCPILAEFALGRQLGQNLTHFGQIVTQIWDSRARNGNRRIR